MVAPSDEGTNGADTNGDGRDQKTGRFQKGWKGGNGNPHAKRAAELRSVIMKATTPEVMRRVWAKVIEQAEEGDQHARRELLERTLGKSAAQLSDEAIEGLQITIVYEAPEPLEDG